VVVFWIHRITGSQNVGVGRDLCGSSSPTPLPKQGNLQQAAEDLVQAGLEYLQRRRLHNLPGPPSAGIGFIFTRRLEGTHLRQLTQTSQTNRIFDTI